MVDFFKSIRFKGAFWVTLVFMIGTGYGKIYAMAFLFAFLHEICHIIVARRFGLETGNICVTPIGCNVFIKDFYSVSCLKRCIILVAGPFFNFLVATGAFFMGMEDIMYINLGLFICNLVPAMPFDGGRIVKNIGGEIIGILKMEKISVIISRSFGVFIVILGILQLIFYNFNISLFCLGVYIMKESKKESVISMYSFYRIIRKNKEKTGVYKTKNMVLCGDAFLWECVRRMTTGRVLMVHICENGVIKETLTQWQIMDRIESEGVFCRCKDNK